MNSSSSRVVVAVLRISNSWNKTSTSSNNRNNDNKNISNHRNSNTRSNDNNNNNNRNNPNNDARKALKLSIAISLRRFFLSDWHVGNRASFSVKVPTCSKTVLSNISCAACGSDPCGIPFASNLSKTLLLMTHTARTVSNLSCIIACCA